jgi:predicted CXXCH cytochrome family protein
VSEDLQANTTKGGDNLRKLWLIIPGLVVAVALAFMAQPTGTANADNGPHIQGWGATPDGCAACHRVHRGVNDFLLLEEVESLCASCHGNDALGSVLNVMAGSNEADGGALRAGGFETARINTVDSTLPITTVGTAESGAQCRNGIDDDADTVVDDGCPVTVGALAAVDSEPTQSRHTIDASAQTIWGNGPVNAVSNPGLAGYSLSCGECHDPHGNGNYRILRSVPSGSGGAGYTIPDTYPKDEDAGHYTTSNYFNMTFTGSTTTDNILKDTSAWCAQCHTRYLAARRAALPADASRVDSGDAIFGFRHTSSGVSYSATTGLPSNVNRACITCHATHGSNATVGTYSGAVPLPNGFAGTGAADSRLLKMDNRGICQKCHNQ